MPILAEAETAVQGVLNDEVVAAVTNGFATLSATVNQVILLSIPTTIGIITLTAGVRYALKKVRGVISQAA